MRMHHVTWQGVVGNVGGDWIPGKSLHGLQCSNFMCIYTDVLFLYPVCTIFFPYRTIYRHRRFSRLCSKGHRRELRIRGWGQGQEVGIQEQEQGRGLIKWSLRILEDRLFPREQNCFELYLCMALRNVQSLLRKSQKSSHIAPPGESDWNVRLA